MLSRGPSPLARRQVPHSLFEAQTSLGARVRGRAGLPTHLARRCGGGLGGE